MNFLRNIRRSSKSTNPMLSVQQLESKEVPAAPVIAPIGDQVLTSNQSQIQVPIPATDTDNDPLTYTVRTAGSEAFFLGADLKLRSGGRPVNWGGQGERWFKGGTLYYFLKSNGDFHRWDGTNKQATGPIVAKLEPVFFYYPDLLTSPKDHAIPYLLDQRLKLSPTASPARGSLGLNEEWLAGPGASRFYITPQGHLFRSNSGNDLLLAQLDPAYHTNPKLLSSARPLKLQSTLTGSVANIGPFTGGSGSFAVQVTASDSTSTARQTFAVDVVNAATPTVTAVSKQLLGVGETQIDINLGGSDANGDVLTYRALSAGTEAFVLATDLQLRVGTRPMNWGGDGEKWLQGRDGWYFIRPSGDLHRWDGSAKSASGSFVASLQPAYYHFADLLTKPQDEDLAYLLDRRLNLSPTADPPANSLGLNERWLKARGGNLFITPNGNLYRQGADAVLLATFPPIYYEELSRLYAAQPDRFSANVTNGVLTVTTKPNYFGNFVVEVQVSDGVNTTVRRVPFEQRYISVNTGDSPRVVSAISQSNKTIIVTFNNPMNSSALNPLNYRIVQTNVNSEAGALIITGARFINENRDAVELTTLSQTAIQYTMSVVNVRDLANRQIAPREVSNGVVNDPSKSDFAGTGPSSGDLTDSDGDGLYDDQEQRGWEVDVELINSGHILRGVTSDPFDADTDDDGLSDYLEANLRLDARDIDTDDDQLGDYQEYNEIFSNAADQDSDDDTLDDNLEFNFFRSSPNDQDTDGDQINDEAEILLGNRDLRRADTPKPGIEIGEVKLALNVLFEAESSRGTRELQAKQSEATLSQSSSKTFGREDSKSRETTMEAGVSVGWVAKTGDEGYGAEGEVTFEYGFTQEWSSSFTQESTSEVQREATDSFAYEAEVEEDETVVRRVEGARMAVSISLQSLSNLAFTISNVQVTAFMNDPASPGKLIPVATLLPSAGVPNSFNLGPLVPERGPFIFENDQIFPSLVEKLMLNPAGLVFKISNYDIVDERDRNFTFSSQEINDRTAPLTIDFGAGIDNPKGNTERYRVSTSSGRVVDTSGDGVIDADDRRVSFDPVTGRAVGITAGDALEQIVGLTHYDEAVTPSSTLTAAQLRNSYSTMFFNGLERLFRVRNVSTETFGDNKGWVAIGPGGIQGLDGIEVDFRSMVLEPEGGLSLIFMEDKDADGIDASQEYKLGSNDNLVDSDGDGLEDRFEFFGKPAFDSPEAWVVQVMGELPRPVFSSPGRADSDGDGLTDHEEYSYGLVGNVRKSLDPQSPDTDRDGVTDFDEINGYNVRLRFPAPGGPAEIVVSTDPLNPDNDGDGLKDGDERTLGVNPLVDDVDRIRDDDNDGLVNFLEEGGFNASVFGVSLIELQQGPQSVLPFKSSKTKRDTDSDGLSDGEEWQLGTNPESPDTDGDGLDDIDEVTITTGNGTRVVSLKYNPLDADVDNDLRSDGHEVNVPIVVEVSGAAPVEVFSDPLKADEDLDGLRDAGELAAGTNPKLFDTDGDNPSIGDRREILLGTNPLTRDRKVTITVTRTQLEANGNVTDNEPGGEDEVEIFGTISVGPISSPSDILSFGGYSFGANDVWNYNDIVRTFILTEGDTISLRQHGLYDNDAGGNEDPFEVAEALFDFNSVNTSGTLASLGQNQSVDNLTIVTGYNFRIDL